ncbi:hypothetical protein [Lutibacter sp. B1]|uniref:hypothetical protein n=1 Tax=Lutibacter sp. B1 TaxID=2725996 RepID=UPI00145752E7|nr:hypothetical protein [Lutibacter sp. B1]NLP56557.1 hypothetical protein [Lutibacter sp. B1]
MRFFKIFLFSVLIISVSCKEKQSKTIIKDTNTSSESIKHYICKNNCENSGGAIAGNCPVCKTPYTHNEIYHAKDFLKDGPLNVPKYNGNQNNKNNSTPAQNSSGVYHYICNNGCYGGSGKSEKCLVCGTTLVHNQAYHNN